MRRVVSRQTTALRRVHCQSMACGTPTVAADASSIPEVVGDGAYLIDPDDSRKLGGALIATLIQAH